MLARVLAIAAQYQVNARAIGSVTQGDFRIQYNGKPVVAAPLESLRGPWATSLERALGYKRTGL